MATWSSARRGGTPAKHAAQIATAISTQLKIEVPVIVKSAAELATVVSENSLGARARDHSRLLVTFVQDNRTLPALEAIGSFVEPPEQLVVGRNALYMDCARGILECKAGAALHGKAGKSATTRNWATVLNLHALANKFDA